MIDGIIKSVDAISKTLGPKGSCVAIQNSWGNPDITRDGVTVSKNIAFKDPAMNMGAQLVKAAASKTEEQAGDGPQPLYAKVLTPNGWTTMGELKIGDKICGTSGTVQEVIGIFHKGQKEIIKMHFSEGQTVECCKDHLWTVLNRRNGGKTYTLTVSDIINNGLSYIDPNNTTTYRYYTPKTECVYFEEKPVTIDPFLLGLLLGDGTLGNNGSIELSLGEKKINVLEDIILPENIKYSKEYVPERHYYRIKFSSIDTSKKSMKIYLKELNLLDSKSSTKFIPKNYLYNSKENREKLLAGLINTDGYINSRGLIEYSTVSEQLHNDIIELMKSLGYSVNSRVHTREKDEDSYSNKPIYRISQLKGYKYGNKLVGIEKTGKFTEMMCIKVSNPDELYITNDYIVTHNTSSCSVLVKEMVTKGQRYLNNGANLNEIKDGMEKMTSWVKEFIKLNSIPVDGDLEKIRKVATISANNDHEVGNLIVKCMEKVGVNGVITADVSSGLDTTVDIVEGFRVMRGWASPHFITSPEDGKCVMENPVIAVLGEKISSVPQILPAIEASIKTLGGRPLLIICDDMDENVMTTLVMNVLQGALRCCVVKGIDFADNRKAICEDISVATGATYICPEYGLSAADMKVENLGSASKVVVSKDSCIIYEGHGDKDDIKARLDIIMKRLEDPTVSDYEKTKFEARVSCLSGGIGIIKAGGGNEIEKNNRKATIEDAILASKSAISEGVVAGAGSIFLKAYQCGRRDFLEKEKKNMTKDEYAGAEIVLESLKSIVWTIGENSGIQGDVLIEKLSKSSSRQASTDKVFGYNAKLNRFGDLLEMGILDSAKVLRVSLENAVSAASMCLLTCCVITDEPEETKAAAG